MITRLRRTLLALPSLLMLAAAPAADAGDAAEAEVIGFSPDGAYVAFEQYGVQDGSGYAYADLFVIDLAADAWVAGTPVRVLLEDYDAEPEAARQAALAQAAPILRKLGIEGRSTGRALLRHVVTDRGVDPHAARFAIFAHGTAVYELQLREREAAAPGCPEEFGPFRLFDLVLLYPGGRRRVLHEDASLPTSRGCPIGYGIAEVWMHGGLGTEHAASLIVLLHMQRPGFEGPDVRFLAVALRPADLDPF